MQPRILIADDQADILSALKLLLKREGFDVATASSPAGVLDITAREHVDVALVDLNYSRDTSGRRYRTVDSCMTSGPLRRRDAAWAVELAVKAIQKAPTTSSKLEQSAPHHGAAHQVQLAEARRRGRRLMDRMRSSPAGGGSRQLARDAGVVRVARRWRAPGERADHQRASTAKPRGLLHDWSDRAGSPSSLNAGGVAGTVFETEMFGP
jgi:DNA-binding NtrC family response regulator